MGFFGFSDKIPEKTGNDRRGTGADFEYRNGVSPLGTDPSQPIEFSLTPEESRTAQEGLLAAKEAAGRADTEKIAVIRDRIFGEQTQSVQSEVVGTPQSQAFINETARFAADMAEKPETQGGGEECIRFDLAPESVPKESDDETIAPSVLGGF